MKEPEILEWIRNNPPDVAQDEAVVADEEVEQQSMPEAEAPSDEPLVASDEVQEEPAVEETEVPAAEESVAEQEEDAPVVDEPVVEPVEGKE